MMKIGSSAALFLCALCVPSLADCGISGDSIARGTAHQMACESNGVRGITAAQIAKRVLPDKNFLVVSAGTNGRTSIGPALKDQLEDIRAQAERYVIWILPTAEERRQIVMQVAHEHHDKTVAFKAGPDGRHPASYPAVANAVRYKMTQIVQEAKTQASRNRTAASARATQSRAHAGAAHRAR